MAVHWSEDAIRDFAKEECERLLIIVLRQLAELQARLIVAEEKLARYEQDAQD